MTKEKFTQGPWRAVRGDAFVFVEAVNIAHIGIEDGDADNASFVAQARPGSEGSIPHNALLTAASPELYEALKNALHLIGEKEGTSDENDAIYDAAKAALSKARGEK